MPLPGADGATSVLTLERGAPSEALRFELVLPFGEVSRIGNPIETVDLLTHQYQKEVEFRQAIEERNAALREELRVESAARDVYRKRVEDAQEQIARAEGSLARSVDHVYHTIQAQSGISLAENRDSHPIRGVRC